jgi:hypothetical protein
MPKATAGTTAHQAVTRRFDARGQLSSPPLLALFVGPYGRQQKARRRTEMERTLAYQGKTKSAKRRIQVITGYRI